MHNYILLVANYLVEPGCLHFPASKNGVGQCWTDLKNSVSDSICLVAIQIQMPATLAFDTTCHSLSLPPNSFVHKGKKVLFLMQTLNAKLIIDNLHI